MGIIQITYAINNLYTGMGGTCFLYMDGEEKYIVTARHIFFGDEDSISDLLNSLSMLIASTEMGYPFFVSLLETFKKLFQQHKFNGVRYCHSVLQ